jgi:flagellar L-ring protein precursor FlgH
MKRTTLNAFIFGAAVLGFAGSAVADSLFNPDGFHAFATDHRAFRPGDSLTVVVTEIASATSTAKTTTSKDGSVTAKLNKKNDAFDLSTALENSFDGGGKTERTGKLLAKITVTVLSIDELGSLNIKGAQTIDVNNERQSISMTGRVRPQDIEADNTVESSRITDAHIEYIGDGVLNEQQRPGILTRILSWLRIL